MKLAWSVLAILLILAGSVFALQGLNLLPGTVMRGSPEWLIIGALMAATGAVLLVRIIQTGKDV